MSCTKSKEVHPEIGDGNDEIVTVGMKDVHVEYIPADISEFSKVMFHYCHANANGNSQQFAAAQMTKKETLFELTLNDLLKDTLYWYYYELYPISGDAFNAPQKTFHTQAFDAPEPPAVELPTVTTAEVSEITANSAQCGGDVINDGGATVTECGICWSTSANPTIDGNHVAAGTGTGAFTASLEGLEANTTYHARAYATNEAGTAYGLDKEFTTNEGGGSGVPEGAIDGLFSVSPTKKVFFSQGNLQYQASTNTWRFAENQWNYVGTQIAGTWWWGATGGNVEGSDNLYISSYYDGWIDLFGWGTSGYNHGAVCYQPWGISDSFDAFSAYGVDTCNLFDNTGQADWGYNAISNGGNLTNVWRTLKGEEWEYIVNDRDTEFGYRFAKATVNEVHGLILLPDNWSNTSYILNNTNQNSAGFGSNIISRTDWIAYFQDNGAVFLPASGYRITTGTTVYVDGAEIIGPYWSSTSINIYEHPCVWCFRFKDENVESAKSLYRTNSFSVRLVQDANP